MALVRYWQDWCAPYLRSRFRGDQRGASLVEYALLVSLIAVVCIGAITVLGSNASAKFSKMGSSLGS
jgi:pilus assembly protein Flp/PilA